MKILHVSGATGWGGNEQQLFDLIFGLQKLGIDNAIFCFKNCPVENIAKNKNIKYSSIPKVKAYSFNYAKSLNKYNDEYKPDIIHIHTSNSLTAYVIADFIFKLKRPTVFSKKGISGAMGLLSTFKYNYININKIICVSEAVKEAFIKVIKPKNYYKLCVVYDGINIERSENKSFVNLRKDFNIPEHAILIGNLANHSNAKDLVTMVKTAKELIYNQEIKNVHFVQIGREGKNTKEFMPLIKEYGLEPYFTCTGFLENAMDLLSQLDIYLMTSEREGLPLTIYEAFFKKIPVVSTKAGGIPEAIQHGYNGLLVNIKEAELLAMNLKTLIVDAELQKMFVERSYKLLFKKFTASQCAVNTLNVYNSLL
ncbi:glycosyltransferase family 4 protein [Confluentibacter flavum]|uniref:Glycosyltransferase family 1 protein n=1 Tax=Confluentibacter flavum TaxID=1909700 RepID=A0A2N3HHA4_9FLAO|nr:glycosyltransferase family 4 protein [Confluentibacter flavum]PKQ44293.1 hypothetical protein CSW08_14440 [Confluentibacter flavum]